MAYPEYKITPSTMWQYLNRNVYDFIRLTRKKIILQNPKNSGDTVTLTLSAPETIVRFNSAIIVDFNLNVIISGSQLGDKLYLIMNSDGGTYTVTSTGNLVFNNCGPDNPPSDFDVDSTDNVVVPFLFDGTNFVGLDYC